jgi:SSS family solute:Na+ symporter
LLLMGYSLVTQLFPALLLCLGANPRVSAASVIAGIVAGELTVVFLTVTSASVATLLPAAPQVVKDLNVGFVALGVNVVVLSIVAIVTRARALTATAPEASA